MMYGGMTTEEWRSMPWWPNGRKANVTAGSAGHDREIVVNIDGYGIGQPDGMILDAVVAVLKTELPETWYVENRGTRIEVHPSGRFAGGYHADDVAATVAAVERMGMKLGVVRDARA